MDYSALAHFGDYAPWDFGWPDPRRTAIAPLLVPFSHSGVAFGSMHRDAVPVFTALLDELVPLIPSKRLVAGQCGCYNPNSRTVGGSPSFHTIGTAIDVNWGSNPMYASGRPSLPDSLPAITRAIATRYGCEWGGDWSYPQDWMHLEVHLTPDVARTVQPAESPLTSTAKPLTVQEDEMLVFAYQGAMWVTDSALSGRAGFADKASYNSWHAAQVALGKKVTGWEPTAKQAANIPIRKG